MQWISVKDKLPECIASIMRSSFVLVALNYNGVIGSCFAYYDYINKLWFDEDKHDRDGNLAPLPVTHWLVVEPPKD